MKKSPRKTVNTLIARSLTTTTDETKTNRSRNRYLIRSKSARNYSRFMRTLELKTKTIRTEAMTRRDKSAPHAAGSSLQRR